MRGPRPVPPKFCAVEASAWLNSSNSLACCSAVMPTPVSETVNSTSHPLRPYYPTIPECLEPRTARTGPAQSAMHTACTSAATWCAPIIGEIARSQVDHRGSVTDHVAAWQRVHVADRHVQRRGVVAEPVSLPWPSRNSVLPSRCRSAVPIMRPLRFRNVVTLPLVEALPGDLAAPVRKSLDGR